MLYTAERLWGHPEGLPGRDWFKHILYAPGLYTGYAVRTLPGIREAIEQARWDEATRHLKIAAEAADQVARRLGESATHLKTITAH
jgi:N-acetylated-alpha-linked acidic dipeptidase